LNKRRDFMKKIVVCLIIMLTTLFAFALITDAPRAAQEAMKETVQAAPVEPAKETAPATPVPGGEPSHKAKKVMGPVDSSEVIPKGPQWLGAPIMPNGKEVTKESGRLVTEYDLPYNQVLPWYQDALKNYPDARYRDWKEEMYIEDQGGSKWHAIKVSKTGGAKTTVTIVKDNWTWIMATLLIRFTGVFVVLLILWIFLNISTAIVLRALKAEEKKKQAAASA
jgi:V8-like Glu-specific endopeptidase